MSVSEITTGMLPWPRRFTVRLGDRDTSSDKDCSTLSGEEKCAPPVVDIPVMEVIVHPKLQLDPLRHDIALLRLAREVEFSDFVRPLRLPPRQDNSTDTSSEVMERLRNVGWGHIDSTANSTHCKSSREGFSTKSVSILLN